MYFTISFIDVINFVEFIAKNFTISVTSDIDLLQPKLIEKLHTCLLYIHILSF